MSMTKEKIPTTEKLAQAMREHGVGEDLIQKALVGYYDDYKSTIATPCMQLVKDLGDVGAYTLRQRAINGEFDAQKWESDEWAESEDGQEAIRSLGLSSEAIKELFGVKLRDD